MLIKKGNVGILLFISEFGYEGEAVEKRILVAGDAFLSIFDVGNGGFALRKAFFGEGFTEVSEWYDFFKEGIWLVMGWLLTDCCAVMLLMCEFCASIYLIFV